MGDPHRSLLDSTRSLLDTTLGLLQTRFELLATEVEEEKARVFRVLLFGAVAVVLLSFGMIFAAFLLTAALWEEHRLLILGILGSGFLLAGGGALALAWRNAKPAAPLLTATIAELKQDRAALRGESH